MGKTHNDGGLTRYHNETGIDGVRRALANAISHKIDTA